MILFVLIFILMVALGVLGFMLYKEKKDRPKCSVAAQLVDQQTVEALPSHEVGAGQSVHKTDERRKCESPSKLLNQVDVGELITLLEELQAVCDVHNVSSIPGMMRCAEDLKNAGHRH